MLDVSHPERVAGHAPLQLPLLAVDREDALAKEFPCQLAYHLVLWVVVKVALQNPGHVLRSPRHHDIAIAGGAKVPGEVHLLRPQKQVLQQAVAPDVLNDLGQGVKHRPAPVARHAASDPRDVPHQPLDNGRHSSDQQQPQQHPDPKRPCALLGFSVFVCTRINGPLRCGRAAGGCGGGAEHGSAMARRRCCRDGGRVARLDRADSGSARQRQRLYRGRLRREHRQYAGPSRR